MGGAESRISAHSSPSAAAPGSARSRPGRRLAGSTTCGKASLPFWGLVGQTRVDDAHQASRHVWVAPVDARDDHRRLAAGLELHLGGTVIDEVALPVAIPDRHDPGHLVDLFVKLRDEDDDPDRELVLNLEFGDL